MADRDLAKVDVAGSIPVLRSKIQRSSVAERAAHNGQVGGSIPPAGTSCARRNSCCRTEGAAGQGQRPDPVHTRIFEVQFLGLPPILFADLAVVVHAPV